MADFSDSSDVNPEEMARMVEELEDLDDTLLGVTSKRDSLPIAKRDAEIKKKISFKDTFDDDPLADLSSDDDDRYTAKKPIVPNPKTNRLADLFGIKNSESVEKISQPEKSLKTVYTSKIGTSNEKSIVEDYNLPIFTNKTPSIVTKTVERSTSQNFKEPSTKSNDETVTKIDEPTKSTSNRDRKSTLMEDIFGSRGRLAGSREIDVRPSSSRLGLENPSISVLPEPSKSEKSVMSSIGYTVEASTIREPRRGRRNSPVISDPLGLFSTTSKQPEPTIDTKPKVEDVRPEKSSSRNDLPEWLGGSSSAKDVKTEIVKKTIKSTKPISEIGDRPIVSRVDDSKPREFETIGSTNFSQQSIGETLNPEISLLVSSQFDQQAAIMSMQQQEHELRTAANLSHQNDQMTRIVECQRSKLVEQEKMFNALIKRQIDRQSMLETQMRIQQARIDHYIQTLMAQPSSLPTVTTLSSETLDVDAKKETKEENSESLIRQLQLETDNLEMTLERLKEKHEKEIQMLEESYEKQISYLRQCIDKLEKKMDRDNESLEKEYEVKIEKLRDDKEQLERNYREEIERLKKNERLHAEEIHERYSHNMEILEKEHAETIDGISRAKEIERSAVETITNRKSDLGDLLERSKFVIEGFENLQKRLGNRDDEFAQNRENYLKKQEENLQLLRDQLNLQQDAVADERKRLAECCQRLDVATINLTSEFAKKNLIVTETEERLATRERGLIRERQLFDEQIKWEREHLQTIKESWMKEQERQLKLLSEDREAIATERTKLKVSTRLQSGTDNIARVELEAALRTAQEAENEANLEMRKWQERSNALETQRRELREKERDLAQRAKELENSAQSAVATRDEGLRALKEAQRMEKQHKERLGQLQAQLESLAERENKVAMEKLALARERLSAYVRPERPEKDVEENEEMANYRNDKTFVSNSTSSTHFKDVVDPHLLLLKLNLDNKLNTSNELLAAMNVTNQ